MNEEIWKDVKGYEGYYQVSNLGNVRSIDRIITDINGVKQKRKGHEMSKRCNQDGYLTVKLTKKNKDKRYFIHKLVAEAFISGKLNESYEVNHKDCNRQNNVVENLEWCSHTENVRYSAKLGHYSGRFGVLNPNYGGTVLKERFKNNPELRMKQARPKEQNGRAVKINMYDKHGNFLKTFLWIGECAEHLKKEINLDVSIKFLRGKISKCSKDGNSLYGFKFERV